MAEHAGVTELFMGRAIPVVGDPTTALGADMVELDEFPTVRVTQLFSTRSGSDRSGHQLASSLQTRGSRFRIELTGYKWQIATLAALIADITVNGEGYDVADETAVVDPPTLAIVPLAEKVGAIDSGKVIWIPAFRHEGELPMTFDDTVEGEDANETFTITLMSLKRFTDQNGTAIPAGSREGFVGSPTVRGLTWTLPSAFDAEA